MITTVKSWSIITINDEDTSFRILWGVVEHSNKFKRGHYVCTSRITLIEDDLVTTKSDSTYKLLGKGGEHTTSYAGLLLLGKGISPRELCK